MSITFNKTKLYKIITFIIVILVVLLAATYFLIGENNPLRVYKTTYILREEASKAIKLDRTFVISLDRTPERYEKIKKLLDEQGLQHEKFSAVDGYEIQIQDVAAGKVFTGRELKSTNGQM